MKTLLALLAFMLTAQAQLIVSLDGGQDLSVGPGTAAFSFTTTAPITLRSLGVWDSDTLTPGLYNAHTIGLWDADTHALLASATVPAQGAASVGEFWYVALATPITLATGHSYVLGATYLDSDFDSAKGNVTSVVTDSRITLGDALLSTSSGFDFPDLNVSGANRGFFGANGLEAVVPEPASMAIVTAILLALFAFTNTLRASEPTVRSVLDAKPVERQRLIDALSKKRPMLSIVNRPPVTPGNEHGKRPVVPPGIVRKYATP